MAKINRFGGNVRAFGADAVGTERTVFGDVTQSDTLDGNLVADFFRGWGIVGASEVPTKQDYNAMGFTLGQLIAYLHQMGVAEWHAAQEYHSGSVAAVSGVLYVSQINSNTNHDPASDDGTNWLPLVPGQQVTTITATGALTARQSGLVLVDATAGNITITLPAATTKAHYNFVRIDTSANTVTIQRAGADTIDWLPNHPLDVYSPLEIVTDCAARWFRMGVVVGSGLTWFKNVAPAGYLECNGAPISRTTYKALFERIGTTWGAGDGSTTFNLPDLRGEFLRGWDNGRGVDAGRAFASAQSDANKLHSHGILYRALGGTNVNYVYSLGIDSPTGTDNAVIGTSGGAEARPRNIAVMFCIKY